MSKRVILDSTNGLRVSKPGFDADTANVKDLIFSSDYRLQRVLQSGSGSFAQGPGSTISTPTDILFGVSYPFVPQCRVIINYDTLNGGLSGPRGQMRFSSSFLIGKDVAVPPIVYNEFSGDSPSWVFIQADPGINVYQDKLTIDGRVGAGTLYYELYEVVS